MLLYKVHVALSFILNRVTGELLPPCGELTLNSDVLMVLLLLLWDHFISIGSPIASVSIGSPIA